MAEAATANASATRNAMFSDCAKIESTIATPPMPNAAIRATPTSCFSVTSPFFHTFA